MIFPVSFSKRSSLSFRFLEYIATVYDDGERYYGDKLCSHERIHVDENFERLRACIPRMDFAVLKEI